MTGSTSEEVSVSKCSLGSLGFKRNFLSYIQRGLFL